MKKLIISVMAMCVFAFSSNAQFVVGGGLSASHTGGVEKNAVDPLTGDKKDIDDAKTNGFRFSPKFGVELGEKMEAGAMLQFGTFTSGKVDKDNLSKTNTFGFVPYFEYKFIEMGKFGVVAEATLPISFSKGKSIVAGTMKEGDPATEIGVAVAPVLKYDLNEHFELECALNFMSFSCYHSVSKDIDDKNHKDIDNQIRFGATTGDLVSVGGLTIGFSYKF